MLPIYKLLHCIEHFVLNANVHFHCTCNDNIYANPASLILQLENSTNLSSINVLIHCIAFFSETLSAEPGITASHMKLEKTKNKLFQTIILNNPPLVYCDVVGTSSCRDCTGIVFQISQAAYVSHSVMQRWKSL